VGLTRAAVVRKVAVLPMTKNGSSRRVPLSPDARAILDALPPADPVFGLSSGILDALWRKCCKRALVDGLHFHDLRALAVTRLAKKLDLITLARMVGHKDLRMLQVYYRESAEDIADKL
jgi:integrase